MRLTLPIISMVITLLYLLKYSAGQWNTLVNFGAALLALSGQFSVGVNTPRRSSVLICTVSMENNANGKS
jgi:hypothetical protein